MLREAEAAFPRALLAALRKRSAGRLLAAGKHLGLHGMQALQLFARCKSLCCWPAAGTCLALARAAPPRAAHILQSSPERRRHGLQWLWLLAGRQGAAAEPPLGRAALLQSFPKARELPTEEAAPPSAALLSF